MKLKEGKNEEYQKGISFPLPIGQTKDPDDHQYGQGVEMHKITRYRVRLTDTIETVR